MMHGVRLQLGLQNEKIQLIYHLIKDGSSQSLLRVARLKRNMAKAAIMLPFTISTNRTHSDKDPAHLNRTHRLIRYLT